MTRPLLAVACKASDLTETLAESIELAESGNLTTARGRLVRYHDLPSDSDLAAVHAQLARLLREGVPRG